MAGFRAQRVLLRSWEPCLQALQDIVGDAERGASFREPPAGNGGKRPVVQQFETFADLFGLLRILGLAVGFDHHEGETVLVRMRCKPVEAPQLPTLAQRDSVAKAPQ